ncbi:tyrosine-type recombinase/integrase [Alkalimarinus alittae]|uniref:Tyrosine-type recombinase/integrase n=1 Tax=Alkalimarinus alittae TaxID=2961619 RepID=A0ABY6N720_9ALTE|nr:tyrosine-type recombinase/integrase [Alkalimarinus alittae]UZE97908.1 tyrosine-type recombinase/integrase [Alkalimarinus alittae]
MTRRTIPSRLTDATIRNAQDKGKKYKLYDGGGLFLEVSKTKIDGKNIKRWKMRYKFAEKERCITIGPYLPNNKGVSLLEAREAALEAKAMLLRGVNPSLRIGNKGNASTDSKFKSVAKAWHENELEKWKTGHAADIWDSLEKDVFPTFGDVPIHEISTQDCLIILQKIEKRGALETCKKIKQRMSCIFDHGIIFDFIKSNPVGPLRKFGKKRKTKGYKAIAVSELSSYLNAVETSIRIEELTRLALQLSVETFGRSAEVREGTWSEIDFEKKLWHIPKERMKNNLDFVIPLSDAAIAILTRLRDINGRRELIFASTINPKKPISEGTLNAAIRRLGFDGTTHGFRKIACTTLYEVGYPHPAIERQLSHVEKNKIVGIYNKAKYLNKRTEFMSWWSEYLADVRLGKREPIEYVID